MWHSSQLASALDAVPDRRPRRGHPLGYRLLAGSSAIGTGTPISGNSGRDYFGNPIPGGAPNIGAYQGGSVCTLALQDIVDPDTQGTVPAGWTLGGPSAFTVLADPGPGFAGNSVRLSTSGSTATLTRGFTASGDVLIDIRLRAAQTTAAVGFHVLDAAAQPVARVSLAASGKLAYTDGASWIDSAFTYTRDSWHRITLLLHPGTGRYDLTADSRPIATPALGTASTPSSVRLNLPAGTPATFTADYILVQATSC